ncbi:uncharacterized protein LOC128858450 [Anastrepha ludens]|uniref:uncharacterized protein LOC128858450 n=1 Tax=Anastrepha ludens TaxID=28586 RepID=UPI0023B008B3|nr:uncharacterized protein LOC128858450 [Anastrepha ludens]
MKVEPSNPVPAWLTREYLEAAFRRYKNDDALRITELDIKCDTSKGEHYLSVLTRIKIKFQLSNNITECGSYVVKACYDDDPLSTQIIKGYDVYNTEMVMYDKVLPKLLKILQEIDNCAKPFADTIHVDYAHSVIILEDLAVLNYCTANRIAYLNETEVELVLSSLAKMHAAAAVLNERTPGVLNKLNMGLHNRSTKGLAPYFEGFVEVCANFAGKCESLGPYYERKLLQLKPNVMEYCARVYEPPQSYFQTLTHGDLWTNNILLRYVDAEANKVEGNLKQLKNAVLIDFQFSSWSSPAVDLHYFFNTSLPNELRIDRQDELVRYYHTVLADTLSQLKYSALIPSLHDICVQMEAGRFYALTSTVVNQCVMINDKADDAEFRNLIGSDERASNFRASVYTNKTVQENIKCLLPYFDRKGLLDTPQSQSVQLCKAAFIFFVLIRMTKTTEPAAAWLTKQYFESILRKYKKDSNLTVTSIIDGSGTSKGDSYISIMTRVKVEYLSSNNKEPQYGFYIAKTSYEGDPVIEKIMKDFDVYHREMFMYDQVLPQMSQLLLEIGDDDKLFADIIHVDFERSAIILEDLSVSHFAIADRLAGMDEQQAKLALRKLAKFHATGAVMNERMPGVLTNLHGGFLRRSNHAFEPFFQGMTEVCADFAGGCKELGAYYKEKLLKLKPVIFEYAVRSFDHKEGHFLTLVHSDMWATNIMLSFETEGQKNGTRSVKDARLIDFQFSNWSSPAVDLHYLINTSFVRELRIQRQDELIQYYHGVLADTLRKFNYGGHVPTLHELSVQLEDRRFYAFTSSLVNHPLTISETTEDADLRSLTEISERSRNFYKNLYSNKRVQDIMKTLLPFFDRKGLLDRVD